MAAALPWIGLAFTAYSALNPPKTAQQSTTKYEAPPLPPTTEPKTGITKGKTAAQAAMLSAGFGTPATTAGTLGASSVNLLGG